MNIVQCDFLINLPIQQSRRHYCINKFIKQHHQHLLNFSGWALWAQIVHPLANVREKTESTRIMGEAPTAQYHKNRPRTERPHSRHAQRSEARAERAGQRQHPLAHIRRQPRADRAQQVELVRKRAEGAVEPL